MGGRVVSTWVLAGTLLGMSLLGLAGPGRASWPTEVSLFPYDVRANSTVDFDLHIVNDKANDAMQLFWVAATFCWNTSYPGVWFKPFRGDFIVIQPSFSVDLVHKVVINRTVPGLCPVVIYINSGGSTTPPTTTNATAWINVLPVPAPAPSPPSPPALKARLAADVRRGQVPLTVAFSAAAQGGNPPYAFAWDFGDGGGSLEQNPIHAYRSPGAYDAMVEVVDFSGRTATSNVTVNTSAATSPARAPDQPFYSAPGNVAALSLGIAVLALAIGLAALKRRWRSPPAPEEGGNRGPGEGGPPSPGRAPPLGSAPERPPAPSHEPPPATPPGPQGPATTPPSGAQSTKGGCARCGAPLLPRAAFCRACGARIS